MARTECSRPELQPGGALVRLGAPWALACALVLKPAMAAEPPTRSERVAGREALRALKLTDEQVLHLTSARTERDQRLAELETQASGLSESKDEVRLKAGERICQQAQESDAAFRRQVTALLMPDQVKALEALRQAFLLLPQIESAQAAGLLEHSQALPPAGLPQGSATVLVRWQRMPARALPGCPTTRVLREVDNRDAKPPRKTPP